ncbi:hypothetical protein DERP_000668 [Dermatophagoides pteronyssinus]|uniref:Uncharacterized protein n=1 Tax=Dermatophagoides pteronyssinus TaxID=6956 RepID=A0ABQ8J147_DERPT|nr:hypothetical protein DERP_000668 [Dermatophagoides pteronyssinus]
MLFLPFALINFRYSISLKKLIERNKERYFLFNESTVIGADVVAIGGTYKPVAFPPPPPGVATIIPPLKFVPFILLLFERLLSNACNIELPFKSDEHIIFVYSVFCKLCCSLTLSLLSLFVAVESIGFDRTFSINSNKCLTNISLCLAFLYDKYPCALTSKVDDDDDFDDSIGDISCD